MGILKPDMGKVLWLLAGALLVAYTGVGKYLPGK